MKILTIHKERVFELVRCEPYERCDGTGRQLAYWRAACQVCGAPFEVSTPAALPALTKSKAFERVHCELHKRAGNIKKGA